MFYGVGCPGVPKEQRASSALQPDSVKLLPVWQLVTSELVVVWNGCQLFRSELGYCVEEVLMRPV